MTETDKIKTGNSNSTTGTNQMIPTRDSDSTSDSGSSDILMPGFMNWNEWVQILRQKYEEKMQKSKIVNWVANQKQHQQQSLPVPPTPKKPKKTSTQTEEVEKTPGPLRCSQIANKDTLEEDATLLEIDHDEHSQRI